MIFMQKRYNIPSHTYNMVKCSKCGSKNERGAKFCRTCGAALKPKDKLKYAKYAYDIYANRKIILAVIGIIIARAVLYPAESIDLHEHEFDGFDLDVPYESDFKLSRNDSLAELC